MPTFRMTTAIFSAAYWEMKNPILLRGERGIAEFYDEDGHVMRLREKIGDGVQGEDGVITGTHWNNLPWFGGEGQKGDTGPMPAHEWSGTSLRFQRPNGSWGERVDLKGEPGNRTNAIPATTTTLGGVMPATGLRVDIEGYEYVALAWDQNACYPDKIVVLHNDSAWLWLKASGIGTETGAQEPGLEASTAYWRKIANINDIPGAGVGLDYDAQANVYDVKYGRSAGTALQGNGTAIASDKLATARNIHVNLANVNAASFNGTQNVQPGVYGVLGVANGGTGVNNLQALKNTLGSAGRLVYRNYIKYSAYIRITGLTSYKMLFPTLTISSGNYYYPKQATFLTSPYISESGFLFGGETPFENNTIYTSEKLKSGFDTLASGGTVQSALRTRVDERFQSAALWFESKYVSNGSENIPTSSMGLWLIAGNTVRLFASVNEAILNIYEI